MAKLTSGRVKKTPQSGLSSDRYQFLGLEQAEPNLGDPLIGPSSIGANPIKVGSFYQLASIGEYPGERYWSTQVGIGTTLGIISVYANGELPNNAFGRIHGLNFVGNGVTVETPSVNFIGDVGIATVRFTVTDILNQGAPGQVLYNGPNGLAIGSTDLSYYNRNVGIGTSLPNSKLEVIGDVFVSGVVTASNFYGNLSGTATTATNVIGGIGSIRELNVSGIATLGITSTTQLTTQNLNVTGVSTLGFVTATNAFYTGVITATKFYGDVDGSIDSATYATKSGVTTNVIGGIASVTSLRVSGISTLGITSTTQLTAQNLNVTGVSTLGFVTATNAFYTGVITATRFYGEVTGFIDNAGYAKTSTDVIGGIASVNQLNVTGFSTLANVYVNNTISGPSIIYIDPTIVGDDTGKVVIKGDLEVKGATTTIESQTLTVADKNIELAMGSTSDSTSDGGGIILKGTTDHTITFNDNDDAWQFSENLTPSLDSSKDLGVSSKKWKALYVNNIYANYTSTTDLRVSGISTLGITSATQLTAQNLNVTGVSTLGFVTAKDAFYTGVVTATRFYGTVDGFVDNAGYASTAGIATYAITAGISTYAITAGIATYAITAGISTYAITAGIATYATKSGVSTNVIGGIASVTSLSVSGLSTFGNNILPSTTGLNLGSPTQQWDNLYVNNITGTLTGAAASISVSADTTNVTRYIPFVDVTSGLTTVRTNSSLSYNPSTGNLGIGTTNPGEKLQVDGNIRVGISTTSNYIAFRGTFGDGVNAQGGNQVPPTTIAYTHTFIGERIYDYSGVGENSELLLFKGNGTVEVSGPDRIRLASTGNIVFDTSSDVLDGTFEEVGISTLLSTKMILTQVGNLGIGTTNPTQKLSVYGAIESLNDGANEGGNLVLRGQPGTPSRWNIDNHTGIVGSGITDYFRIFREDETTGANGRTFVSISSTGEFIIANTGLGVYPMPTGTTNQQLQVQSGAYISGNLGIGTTAPTDSLDVNGTTRLRGFLKDFNNSQGTPGQLLQATSTGVNWVNANAIGTSSTITILDDNSNQTQYLTFVTGIGDTTLGISTTTTALAFNPSTGNLGIGTTNPGEKLQVDGNIRVGISTTSNYIAFRGTYNDDQTPYTHTYIGERIYDDGERSELLLFKGNDSLDVLSGTVGPDRIRLAAGEFRFDTIVSNTLVAGTFEQVAISTNIINKMILTGDGNLGIGTTNPTSKLQVAGNITPSQDLTYNLGSSDLRWNNLYVGIVTANEYYGTFKGTIDAGVTLGLATVATRLQNLRTFEITGDVVASPVTFDGTGNVSLAATIQPNSVGLGTDTFGDYVKSISGTTNQIGVTGGTGESLTPVIGFAPNPIIPGNVTIGNDLQVNNNLNVTGNITIGGTSAYVVVDSFKVSDADIVLGFTTNTSGNDVSNDTTANHGGIAIASTEGNSLVNLNIVGIETLPVTYKKFMWFKAGAFVGLNTDAWLSNYAIGIGSIQFPSGTRLAVGSVQFTENDLSVVRNINSSGIISATEYYGTFKGSIDSGVILDVSNYSKTSGISTNVIGGIGSITQLQVTGVSTFTNGPVLVGSGTSTGTASQRLQVTGGAYVSGNLGIGTTNPTSKLDVRGNVNVVGVSTFTGSIIQNVVTLTAVSNVYTLDITAANEFVTAAAIAGATTINLSNLTSLPAGYRWRGVLSFAYTSGTVTWFAGNTGYTVKWDGGTAPTLTASDLETVVITVTGGSTVIEVTAQQGRA